MTVSREFPGDNGFVEEGATIGMTALVYWQLHSSLYTGVVQGYWSTPDWSDHRQGCRQVSTVLPLSSGLGREEKRSEVQSLSVDGTGTVSVTPVMAPLVQGVRRNQMWGSSSSYGQSLTCVVAAAATGVVRSSWVMFEGSEKAGKIQRFIGHSSQEE